MFTLAEIDRFTDVPIPVEIRIGSRQMTFTEVMNLKAGSIILLEKPAGETLDLLVGSLRMGSVEVVVVDDKLSARVTETEPLVHAPDAGERERPKA